MHSLTCVKNEKSCLLTNDLDNLKLKHKSHIKDYIELLKDRKMLRLMMLNLKQDHECLKALNDDLRRKSTSHISKKLLMFLFTSQFSYCLLRDIASPHLWYPWCWLRSVAKCKSGFRLLLCGTRFCFGSMAIHVGNAFSCFLCVFIFYVSFLSFISLFCSVSMYLVSVFLLFIVASS